MAAALLTVTNLAAERGERRLFSGLAFSVDAGQLLWLRGRNGAGKSTLLRLLCGLATPAAGTVSLGVPSLAYVAHANALKADLAAVEALAFIASLHAPAPGAKELQQAMTRLGVAHCARAPVRTLSQGQQRRIALARLALPGAPRLWLLDEPFDALDDAGTRALAGLLAEHAARGGATVLTSHQVPRLDPQALRTLDLDVCAASHVPAPA